MTNFTTEPSPTTEALVPFPLYRYEETRTYVEVGPDGPSERSYRPWTVADRGSSFATLAAHQGRLNDALARGLSLDTLRASMVAAFRHAHEPHRQYDGWTDDAELVVATHRVTGKGGVRAEVGDLLLARWQPSPGTWSSGGSTWLAWCPRVAWNCELRSTDARRVSELTT